MRNVIIVITCLILGSLVGAMLKTENLSNSIEPTNIRHKPKPQVIIDTFEKDGMEYLIFITEKDAYGNGGGVAVVNHTRELLITKGLENQVLLVDED
jgi:uncharacterized membrane protein YqgA involved in biofilm formation